MTGPDFQIPEEVDPGSPLFFLSYAHSLGVKGHEPNGRFIRFFEDLSENVGELVARPAGSDPGYMDRSIPDGGRWTAELLTAIGTCQVFVALLSSPYFRSEWCALEWHAFARRRVRSRLPGVVSHQTAIIPVIWAPIRTREIPGVVNEVQRFDPRGVPGTDIATRYRGEGIVGLRQLKDDAYEAVVWRLAQRIAEVHETHYVEPRILQRSELRNIFREQAV